MTPEQVREIRDGADARVRLAALRKPGSRGIATLQADDLRDLCDSWLLQQKVVDAAQALDDELVTNGETPYELQEALHVVLVRLDGKVSEPSGSEVTGIPGSGPADDADGRLADFPALSPAASPDEGENDA